MPEALARVRLWIGSLGLICAAVVASATLPIVSAAEIARYQPPAPPPLSADAVYVMDATTGTELFALNPDQALPPASLTKVVSALVVLDRANFDDVVEIVEEDLVSAEQSQVGLVAGDRLSVRDLFVGMLVPSGNDATLALARHVGAQDGAETIEPEQAVARFVEIMNETAHELGASSSHFANPTGMDADGHVMSARDIAIVTAAALREPMFAETVATREAVLASEARPDGYAVQTTNALLLEGEVSGVKTGTTPKAGGCLVTLYPVGPNDVVAVVLGSEIAESTDGLQDNSARFSDTRALLDAVTADYVWLDPGQPGTIAGLLDELLVWEVSLGDAGLLPVPVADAPGIRYRLVLEPPADSEDPAGEVQFYVGDRLLSKRTALQIG